MIRLRFDPGGIPRILKGGRVFTILGLLSLFLSIGVLFLLVSLPSYEVLGRDALVWTAVGLGILDLYLILSALTQFELLLPIDTSSEPERIEEERDRLLALFASSSVSGAESEFLRLQDAQSQLTELLELIPKRVIDSARKGSRKRGKKKVAYLDPLEVLRIIVEENAEQGQIKKDLAKLDKLNRELQEKSETLLARKAEEAARLVEQCDDAEKKLQQVSEALNLAGRRIDSLEQERGRLSSEVANARAALQESESLAQSRLVTAQSLERQLESIKRELSEFELKTNEQLRSSSEEYQSKTVELQRKVDKLQDSLAEAILRRVKVVEEMDAVREISNHVHPGSSLARHVRKISRILCEAETRLQIASILAQDNRWEYVETLTRPARFPDVLDSVLAVLPDELRTYCANYPKYLEEK
jgi:phage host-nuclease inhibitor protein Gam